MRLLTITGIFNYKFYITPYLSLLWDFQPLPKHLNPTFLFFLLSSLYDSQKSPLSIDDFSPDPYLRSHNNILEDNIRADAKYQIKNIKVM